MGNTLKKNPEGRSSRSDFNYQMCILSVIGIIFVLLGHLKNDFSSAGTFYGWFPYYSFHMPLFFFISGYFFRDSCDDHFLRTFPAFLWKKTKKLLIPYYLINGCFLLLSTVLIRADVFYGTAQFSFYEWLIQPWVRVEPWTFSHPTWFLLALFISEIFFLLIRRFFSLFIRKPLVKEVTLTVIFLILAVVAVYLIDHFELAGTEIVYLRSVYTLPYLQLGILYRKYLEKKDVVPGWIYFLIIFIIQLGLILYSLNSPLTYSYVKMEYFGEKGLVALVAAVTGIALWLRISRYLAMIPIRSRIVLFIGENTKYIMSFHLFGFFLTNLFFNYINTFPDAVRFLEDFSPERFRQEAYYVCNTNPRTVIIYFAVSMTFSLLLAKLIGLVKKGFRKIFLKQI